MNIITDAKKTKSGKEKENWAGEAETTEVDSSETSITPIIRGTRQTHAYVFRLTGYSETSILGQQLPAV